MPALEHGPTAAQYLDQLQTAGRRIEAAALGGGLGAAVPSCPGWTVDDVVRHVGGAHRWAHDVVQGRKTGRGREMFGLMDHFLTESLTVPSGDLLAWFHAGLEQVITTLSDTPDDAVAWTFLPDGGVKDFWSRRQAHETGMHSIDAQLAARDAVAAAVEPFPAWFAADGIDELLTGFVVRPGAALRSETPRTLAVIAQGCRYLVVTIGPDAIRTERGPSDAQIHSADASITGGAHDIYCELWNRPPIGSVQVGGDASLVEAWHGGVRIQ